MASISNIRTVNDNLINTLVEKAKNSSRRRAHFCFHEYHEKVQRMVNVLLKGSYVPPHKHQNPDKVEHFFCIKGKLACVNHDEKGVIKNIYLLQPQGPTYAIDVPPNTYHMFVCLQEPSAMMEIVEGPYDQKTHKKFPSWAPKENETNAKEYLAKIEQEIISFINRQ